MSDVNGKAKDVTSKDIAKAINHEITAVRSAWRLTPPERRFREPQWLRSAVSQAVKAGKLPKRIGGESVLGMLSRAGYATAIDHMAIVRDNGERHVILEPYETSCNMDTARGIAAELATLLGCDAWVSLRSWHYPGWTIRITLAPSHEATSESPEPSLLQRSRCRTSRPTSMPLTAK